MLLRLIAAFLFCGLANLAFAQQVLILNKNVPVRASASSTFPA